MHVQGGNTGTDSSLPAGLSETEAQWGALPEEMCRFCNRQGGVQFWYSELPLDRHGPQVVRCVTCKNVWNADGPLA